jgi:ankyrin repeat protein
MPEDGRNSALLTAVEARSATDVADLLVQQTWATLDLREALFRSITLGCDDITASLLRHGLDVNIADEFGTTALMLASRTGRLGGIRLLMEFGARVDARDIEGWTALFYAARAQQADAVQLLLDAGSDTTHRDAEGHSVLYVARRKNFGIHLPFGIVIGWLRPTFTSEAYRILERAGAPR